MISVEPGVTSMSVPSISQVVVPRSSCGTAIVYRLNEEAWKLSPAGSRGVSAVFEDIVSTAPIIAAMIGITTRPIALASRPSAPKTVRLMPRRLGRGAWAYGTWPKDGG